MYEDPGNKGEALGYADPAYVSLAQRAAERWRALEAEAATTLLHTTPQLTFGPGAEAVFAALAAAGAAAVRISAAAIEARFPAFTGRGDAVLETESAVIDADRTLAKALQKEIGAKVWVNDKPYKGDPNLIKLTAHVDIVIEGGPPFPTPPKFTKWGTL